MEKETREGEKRGRLSCNNRFKVATTLPAFCDYPKKGRREKTPSEARGQGGKNFEGYAKWRTLSLKIKEKKRNLNPQR